VDYYKFPVSTQLFLHSKSFTEARVTMRVVNLIVSHSVRVKTVSENEEGLSGQEITTWLAGKALVKPRCNKMQQLSPSFHHNEHFLTIFH
jgi:hypothetical protein